MKITNVWIKYAVSIVLFIIINGIGNLLTGDVSMPVSIFSFAILKYPNMKSDDLIFKKSQFRQIVLPILCLFFWTLLVVIVLKNKINVLVFNIIVTIGFGLSIGILQKNFWNYFDNKM